jgi:hypothetical protein
LTEAHFTDFGFDATYQYLVNPRHIFELNGTIRENRNMNAGVALGFAEKQRSSLDTVRIRSAYTFLQTYALTLAYAQTSGTADTILELFGNLREVSKQFTHPIE